MNFHRTDTCGNSCETDHGCKPFVANIANAAQQNTNFRTAFWTGCHLQMTVMSIPVRGEIGVEMHPDTDQFLRVEEGQGVVRMGRSRNQLDIQCRMNPGDAVFVPGGTWHNLFNTGNCPLKLSSFYAPPQHPKGTVHCTKEDAESQEQENNR